MKRIFLSVAAIAMTFATLPAAPYDEKPSEPTAEIVLQQVTSEPDISCATEETAVQPIYTAEDAIAVAQTLWGEARGCSIDDQKNVVRTICNRCDDSRFPDTPYEVVTQAYQYAGYSPDNPVTPELIETAVSVLEDWSLRKQGVQDIEWTDYLWFTGNGVYNSFRSRY